MPDPHVAHFGDPLLEGEEAQEEAARRSPCKAGCRARKVLTASALLTGLFFAAFFLAAPRISGVWRGTALRHLAVSLASDASRSPSPQAAEQAEELADARARDERAGEVIEEAAHELEQREEPAEKRDDEVRSRSRSKSPALSAEGKEDQERESGEITRWNKEKGYGFIKPAKGGDFIFVHVKGLVNGDGSVKEGDWVTFLREYNQKDKKYMAVKVKLDPEKTVAKTQEREEQGKDASPGSRDKDDRGQRGDDDRKRGRDSSRGRGDDRGYDDRKRGRDNSRGRDDDRRREDSRDRGRRRDDSRDRGRDRRRDDSRDRGRGRDRDYDRDRGRDYDRRRDDSRDRGRDHDRRRDDSRDRGRDNDRGRSRGRDDRGRDSDRDRRQSRGRGGDYDSRSRGRGRDNVRDGSRDDGGSRKQETGTMLRWNYVKGFGFIAPTEGGEDIFAHASGLVGGEGSVREGDLVTFVRSFNDRKHKDQAVEVRLAPNGQGAGRRQSRSRSRGRKGSPGGGGGGGGGSPGRKGSPGGGGGGGSPGGGGRGRSRSPGVGGGGGSPGARGGSPGAGGGGDDQPARSKSRDAGSGG